MDYEVPTDVPVAEKFCTTVENLCAEHSNYITAANNTIVQGVKNSSDKITNAYEGSNNQNAEREQQQEKEQEQEKEKEKEREREREGQFTRDDEQHNVLLADKMTKQPQVSGIQNQDFTDWVLNEPFYPLHNFMVPP